MIRLTLDKALEKAGITRYQLAQRTEIHYHIIDRYFKNRVIRYDSFVLDRICAALDCDIADLICYTENET